MQGLTACNGIKPHETLENLIATARFTPRNFCGIPRGTTTIVFGALSLFLIINYLA
jgi:hypothetical protein